MSRKDVSIEEARATLGDLITAAQQGADIVITRHRKPAARLIAYQEDAMTTDQAAHPAKGDSVIDKIKPECGPGTVTGIRPYERYVEWDDGSRSWTNVYHLAPSATTAAYTNEGRILVGGTEIGTFDADGGEWREPVKTILRQHGYEPVGEWQPGPAAYDPATIQVRAI